MVSGVMETLFTVLNLRLISKGFSLNGIGDSETITLASVVGKLKSEGVNVICPLEVLFKTYFHMVALFKK
jgi:hypothetical protein